MKAIKQAHNFFKKPLVVFITAVMFLSVYGLAFAQTRGGGAVQPSGSGDVGDVQDSADVGSPSFYVQPSETIVKASGWAWMGVGIVNQNVSEGGGGWLNFNCDPQYCDQNNPTPNSWGVSVNIDESSSNYGKMYGEAWSNNYGWLTFDPSRVAECWQANPSETASTTAKILFGDLPDTKKVVGWAKFTAGESESPDGWDGCVSFSGNDYSVQLDAITGKFIGWAWGGSVVGWVSFSNRECPFCDVGVDLPKSVNIDFWADNLTVVSGGDTTLRWQATNTNPAKIVRDCPTHTNTSGYNHWGSNTILNTLFGGGPNVGNISVNQGNLPLGEHSISGITQTTTYTLRCIDSDGAWLPTKYVTIDVVDREILGCTNRNASNYNPLATVDDGSCTNLPILPILGCMDPLALNYNPLATINAINSCRYGAILGCTNPLYSNYDPLATQDNGSCQRALNLTATNPSNTSVGTNTTTSDIPVGSNTSSGYPVTLNWTKTPASVVINSCTGTFRNQTGTTNIAISGWSTGPLANPPSSVVGKVPTNLGIVGEVYRFTINCLDATNQPISDFALIAFTPPQAAESIQLLVNRPTIVIGTPPVTPQGYPVVLTWSKNPTLANVNSCTGTFRNNANTATTSFTGWTGISLANPNSNTSVVIPTSYAVSGSTWRFTINCLGSQGQTLTDYALVTFTDNGGPGDGCPPNCPPGPPPTLDLRILTPDTGFGPNYERLPNGGANVTLGWSTTNVDLSTCQATSLMDTVGGGNLSWNNTPINAESGTKLITNIWSTSPATYYATRFRLSCVGNDGTALSDDVRVVIDGVICTDPTICPQPTGSGVPGYTEF